MHLRWNLLRSTARLFVFGLWLGAGLAVGLAIYRLPEILDPQGEYNHSCIVEALTLVSNGLGMTISGHHTFCDNFVHDSAVYIYLHRVGEVDGLKSLIFRYIDKPLLPLPKVQWDGINSVSINVEHIVQATRIVQARHGISIHYNIQKADFADEFWQGSPLTMYGGFLLLGGCFGLSSYLAKRSL